MELEGLSGGTVMEGRRHTVSSADGTRIGLLTAGQGPALLLVHGGMGRIERWAPIWGRLTAHWRVTAMDRRGRGSSGDSQPYAPAREYDDIAAVAASLAEGADGPVDVFAHSIGATYTLGAAARGAPLRRIALYEPPGPQTNTPEWRERVTSLVAAGRPGPAMVSFLTEVVGLSREKVEELKKSAPGGYDVLPIVSATMPREARALATIDLTALAAGVTAPVLLVVGALSPPWAQDLTAALHDALADATVATLPGSGHEGLDTEPDLLRRLLLQFFRR
jgi:pimeloyl-ACP methyl ester carboxylesterase